MTHRPLFSIGYGNRSLEEFIHLLQQHGVQYLGDVRTVPYSKYSPAFSRDELALVLRDRGIRYVYLGDTLGGNPDDDAVWQDNRSGDKHYVRYDQVRQLPAFRAGLQRLQRAWEMDTGLAIMCSEARPEQCHRVRLIGEALKHVSVDIVHIDEEGILREQDEIMQRIDNGQSRLPGFGPSEKALRSSKAFG